MLFAQDIVKKVNDKLAARERPGRILSLDEVVQMGKENMVTAEDGFGGKPSRKDLYCIMVSGDVSRPCLALMIRRSTPLALRESQRV